MKTDNIYFPCKFVLLLDPIETLIIFVCKFVLLGQIYSLKILSKMASSSLDNIWPEPDSQEGSILDQWEETVHTGTAGMTAVPLAAKFGSLAA
jgi:hypothetical protein